VQQQPTTQAPGQARRQDLGAGGGKNQKEGPKTRRGAHFQNRVLDVCNNRGAKCEMGGNRFQMGGRAPLDPAGNDPAPGVYCFALK